MVGNNDLDPSSYPLKLVKLEYDVNPSKKGWEKFKLILPPSVRSRHMDDPIYGAEWKDLMHDFDEKQLDLFIN